MNDPSRRCLLAGTASALALGAAGCLGQAPSADETPTDDSTDGQQASIPDGVAETLSYVYAQENGESVQLRILDPGSQGSGQAYPGTPTDVGDSEWAVYVGQYMSGRDTGGLVATGSYSVDGAADRYTADGTKAGFDLYVTEDDGENGNGGSATGETSRVLATDGETLLLGPREWVASTLDRNGAGEDAYLDARDGARVLLEALEFPGQTVLIDGSEAIQTPFDGLEVETATLPDLLAVEFSQTSDTIDYRLGGWYTETPDTDNVETLESFLSSQLSMEDPTVELRETDQVVVVEGSRPYVPPEERPETAGVPRFDGYDEQSGEILFRFDQGEQVPADRYELEIEDEVYEGDWTRGQDEIGEGDVVAIDAGAIEPGDDFSITYESPNGGYSSGSGTSALRQLPFDVDFDPDARTAAITYGDGPPLPADQVSVVVSDGERTVHPWDSELTEGDAATVTDLPMDAHLTIEYERSDGEQVRIGGGTLDAPGQFSFDYDGQRERLTITYPDLDADLADASTRRRRHVPEQEPLDAGRYEITLDGDSTDRQWGDAGAEITPGDSLTLGDVPIDTEVAVVWLSESGERYDVDGFYTVPTVEFAFEYDTDSDELTVHHAGGQPVDPSGLAIRFHHPEERTDDWDTDGPFAEGDTFVVPDVDENAFGLVTYHERHLDRVHVAELRQADRE